MNVGQHSETHVSPPCFFRTRRDQRALRRLMTLSSGFIVLFVAAAQSMGEIVLKNHPPMAKTFFGMHKLLAQVMVFKPHQRWFTNSGSDTLPKVKLRKDELHIQKLSLLTVSWYQ